MTDKLGMSDIILKAAVGKDADTVTLPQSVTAGDDGCADKADIKEYGYPDTPIVTRTTNSSSAI